MVSSTAGSAGEIGATVSTVRAVVGVATTAAGVVCGAGLVTATGVDSTVAARVGVGLPVGSVTVPMGDGN